MVSRFMSQATVSAVGNRRRICAGSVPGTQQRCRYASANESVCAGQEDMHEQFRQGEDGRGPVRPLRCYPLGHCLPGLPKPLASRDEGDADCRFKNLREERYRAPAARSIWTTPLDRFSSAHISALRPV